MHFTKAATGYYNDEDVLMAHKPLMSLDRIGALVHIALEQIANRDGSAPASDIIADVERIAQLTDIEMSLNKSGIPRWETNLRFYTTSCVKAGYLQKSSGYWKITDQGRAALKTPPAEFIREVNRKYNEWNAQRKNEEPRLDGEDAIAPTDDGGFNRTDIFEKAEEQAQAGIEEFVHALAPYDFQKLIGYLLRGMG